MRLSLPIRIQGQYPDGATWEEMTTTSDASAGGASAVLRHIVLRGQAVHISLPLPKRFRTADVGAPSYRVYAVISSVKPNGEVGLRFLGKDPPGGYTRNDAGLFLMPPVAPSAPERRAHPRREGAFFFVIKPVGEGGERRAEAIIADNLGLGGARVKTLQPFVLGEVLEIEEAAGAFRTRATVRNVSLGSDNVWRLNLMFVDTPAPDRRLP